MDQDSSSRWGPYDYRVDEAIAEAQASHAISLVREALADFDQGDATVLDVLSLINLASSDAVRATYRGWDFLSERRAA